MNPFFAKPSARRSDLDASEARSSDDRDPPRASRNLRVRVTQRGDVYIASEAVIAKSRRNTSRRRVANASAVSRDWPLARRAARCASALRRRERAVDEFSPRRGRRFFNVARVILQTLFSKQRPKKPQKKSEEAAS